jgi:hypothetical protein
MERFGLQRVAMSDNAGRLRGGWRGSLRAQQSGIGMEHGSDARSDASSDRHAWCTL